MIRITTLHASTTDTDVTWTSPETVIWSMGEVSCAIICVCVPTLRPLLSRSYRPWARPYEANVRRESKGLSWRTKRQRSSQLGYLETQSSVPSPANADAECLQGEVSLDRTIQKPSSCYIRDYVAESGSLSVV